MDILVFGDLHFKTDNIPTHQHYLEHCEEYFKSRPNVRWIVLLGDILHYHERLHVEPLNQFILFLKCIQTYYPTATLFILVGNHDMINHKQFLTEHHWMNVCKLIPNVVVVDRPVGVQFNVAGVLKWFLFCPYVPNGMFLKALELLMDRYQYDGNDLKPLVAGEEGATSVNDILGLPETVLFAHQEFKGCSMQSLTSEDGDDWNYNSFVISGHIHTCQFVGSNIFYTGSSICTNFSETHRANLYLLQVGMEKRNEDEPPLFERHHMSVRRTTFNIPKKITLKYSYEDVLCGYNDILAKLNDKEIDSIKVIVDCSIDRFKMLKTSSVFKLLSKKNNLKIVHKPTNNPIGDEQNNGTSIVGIPNFLSEIKSAVYELQIPDLTEDLKALEELF